MVKSKNMNFLKGLKVFNSLQDKFVKDCKNKTSDRWNNQVFSTRDMNNSIDSQFILSKLDFFNWEEF